MNIILGEFSRIGALVFIAIILASILIIVAYLFSTSAPDVEKLSAYECGFDPYEDARNVFDVRFYLVAILFLVFDLEAMYIYPCCTIFGILSSDGIWTMIDFIVELIIGFIYAWKIGALEWS